MKVVLFREYLFYGQMERMRSDLLSFSVQRSIKFERFAIRRTQSFDKNKARHCEKYVSGNLSPPNQMRTLFELRNIVSSKTVCQCIRIGSASLDTFQRHTKFQQLS